jgi:hypothetical protein
MPPPVLLFMQRPWQSRYLCWHDLAAAGPAAYRSVTDARLASAMVEMMDFRI